jgi:hypothetical protein
LDSLSLFFILVIVFHSFRRPASALPARLRLAAARPPASDSFSASAFALLTSLSIGRR